MKEVKAEDSESIEDIVELSLLYSGSDVTWVAAIETLCDEFMAQNPNIIINTENSGEANCENELKVKEALDEFPDIFELENVDAFADAGKLPIRITIKNIYFFILIYIISPFKSLSFSRLYLMFLVSVVIFRA